MSTAAAAEPKSNLPKTEKIDEKLHAYSTKVIDIPADKGWTHAEIFYVSCMQPEASGFKVTHIPVFQRLKHVFRVLVVAGNLSNFAGDLNEALISHWTDENKTAWNHVVFVPGPFDYGPGTVCMGDARCAMMRQEHDPTRLTVCDHPTLLEIPFFGLRLVGAPLWPVDTEVAKHARVFMVSEKDWIPGVNDAQEYLTQVAEAARKQQYVTKEELTVRSARDRVGILSCLRDIHQCNLMNKCTKKSQAPIVIVATYSAPDEQLSTDIRELNPYRATTTMGSKQMYTLITSVVYAWIVGAHTNKPAQTIKSEKGDETLVVSNPYIRKESAHADGFLVKECLSVGRVSGAAAAAGK